MAERLTVSQIRTLYEAIEEANKTLPNFDEVDFETKWQTIELIYRTALGISGEEGPGDATTLEELRTEILEMLQDSYRVYDQAGFFEGKPDADEILYRYIACRRTNFAENFDGSVAKCAVAPTAEYVIKIYRGSTEIGTITFGAGVTTGVFASSGAFTLAIKDTLTFQAPAVADDTFETLVFNLKANWSE